MSSGTRLAAKSRCRLVLLATLATISLLPTAAFAAFTVAASQSSPVSGAVVLTASGMSTTGLLGITFWMDGHGDRPPWGAIKLAAEDTTSPYQITWAASIEKDGGHRIRAVARYASSSAVSEDLVLTVSNPEHYTGLRYVNGSTGNDGSDGLTPATAWRTIGKVNATLTAGMTALFRGTFNNQTIAPGANGTAAQPIKYKKEPGQAWTITNTEVAIALPSPARYIIIDGPTFSYASNPNPLDSMRFFSCDHMAFRNYTINRNYLMYLDTCTDSRFQDGVQNESGDQPPGNGGDSIFVGSGSSRNLFEGLTNTRGGHSTILVGGGFPGDALVADNTIRNCVFDNDWSQPILLQWRAERTLIEHNIARNGGQHPNSQAGSKNGVEIYSSRNIFRYNEVYNNKWSGIQLQAFTGLGLNMDAHENEIYHNVFHDNGDNSGAAYAVNLLESGGRTIRNNKFYNNIFFENEPILSGGNKYQIGILTTWAEGNMMGNEIRNNIFQRVSGEIGLIVVHQPNVTPERRYTLLQFQAIWSGGVSGNLEVDPLFVDKVNHDYRLQALSPAINVGLTITGYPFIGLAPDLGAFESGDGMAPDVPGGLRIADCAAPTWLSFIGEKGSEWICRLLEREG